MHLARLALSWRNFRIQRLSAAARLPVGTGATTGMIWVGLERLNRGLGVRGRLVRVFTAGLGHGELGVSAFAPRVALMSVEPVAAEVDQTAELPLHSSATCGADLRVVARERQRRPSGRSEEVEEDGGR